MAILGVKGKPFQYLDQWCPEVDWDKLHAEVGFGIAQANWRKTPVSAGVHPNWKMLEMATYYFEAEKHLTPYQLELFNKLPNKAQKIKYLSCITNQVHPFWVLLLRANVQREQTSIKNKALAEDCYWTEDAQLFPSLVDLIEKLPLKSVGRVILFMTEANNGTVPHYDGIDPSERNVNDEFIYFTTERPSKKIFVMDEDTTERFYPDESKRFLWFNEKDYHGTEPCHKFSFSIRIEGKFSDSVEWTEQTS